MVRQLVVGNGSLFVSMDSKMQVRELTFPYAGLENHVLGEKHRVGVFTEGMFSWLESNEWKVTQKYMEDTLVTNSIAVNTNLGLELRFQECVDCKENIFLRKVIIKNNEKKRKIKIFFHQDFHIYQHSIGDTAAYDPKKNNVVHYKRKRYFIVNALKQENWGKKIKGDICEYSIGQSETGNLEGTWKDAEDGKLEKNAIAQGSIDSTIALEMELSEQEEKAVLYWICCGKSFDEADKLNKKVLMYNPEKFFRNTQMCWQGLVNSHSLNLEALEKTAKKNFNQSMLIVRAHLNKNGSLIAACDSDNLRFNSDTYSYMWPRDACLSFIPLCRLGYLDLVKPFFFLCKKIIAKPGCMLHKYHPDGSLGSSWHPWQSEKGEYEIPIQEDETALVLVLLEEYYKKSKDKKLLSELKDSLIIKIAEFLYEFRDKNGLPLPSYDLWEERKGVFSYTCATVYKALKSAAFLLNELGENEEKYLVAAKEVKKGIEEKLFDERENRFLRGMTMNNGVLEKDFTVDSSTLFLSLFEVFPHEDKRIKKTVETINQKLWVKGSFPGLARYENDFYQRVSHDITGNPWVICTLWMAIHELKKAKTIQEIEKIKKFLSIACSCTQSSGIMPEQYNPFTGEAVSIAPLVWSHSTFMDFTMQLIKKEEELR